MKNLVILMSLSIGLSACSGGNDRPTPLPLPPSNQAPTVAAISNQTIEANQSAEAIAVSATDDVTLPQDLVFTISSDNDALIPSAAVVVDTTATGATLVITPTTSVIGTANLILTVTDASGASDSASFLVTVNRQAISYRQFLRDVFSDSTSDLPRDINSVELTGSELDENFSDLFL